MIESIQLKRDCMAIAVPSGARKTLAAGTAVRIVQARGGDYTVSDDIHAMYRIGAEDADALGFEPPQIFERKAPGAMLAESMVWDALKTVYDPEIPVNVVDLGLIYSCAISPDEKGGKVIDIQMTLTAPACGMSNVLKADVESRLMRLPQVTQARVEVVFDPPWSPARMSEAARLQLGLDLDSPGDTGFVQISRW